MTLLLRMVSGSRLYGTNHSDSDWDIYEIVDQGKPFQKAHDPEYDDLTCWPLSMFMRLAAKGAHNALDLMFASPDWPEVDKIRDLRVGYVADRVACWRRFNSTIDNLREKNTPKSLRHANRLTDNLEDIMRTGRYDPRWKNA